MTIVLLFALGLTLASAAAAWASVRYFRRARSLWRKPLLDGIDLDRLRLLEPQWPFSGPGSATSGRWPRPSAAGGVALEPEQLRAYAKAAQILADRSYYASEVLLIVGAAALGYFFPDIVREMISGASASFGDDYPGFLGSFRNLGYLVPSFIPMLLIGLGFMFRQRHRQYIEVKDAYIASLPLRVLEKEVILGVRQPWWRRCKK